MIINDQTGQSVSDATAKDAWVKPEITSFAAAVEAQGNAQTVTADGLKTNLS